MHNNHFVKYLPTFTFYGNNSTFKSMISNEVGSITLFLFSALLAITVTQNALVSGNYYYLYLIFYIYISVYTSIYLFFHYLCIYKYVLHRHLCKRDCDQIRYSRCVDPV